MKKILSALIILTSGCAVASETIKEDSITNWLSSHTNYRLADISDCNCNKSSSDKSKEPVSTVNPYRTEGDFDGDGKLDYAVVVVDKKSARDFLILVFVSKFDGGKSPITYTNPFVDEPISQNSLSTSKYKSRTLLLFGGFNTEAETIDIPTALPK